MVGFDQLGGHDNFSTEMLEWRLGVSKAINYRGDISQPPGKRRDYETPIEFKRILAFISKQQLHSFALESR